MGMSAGRPMAEARDATKSALVQLPGAHAFTGPDSSGLHVGLGVGSEDWLLRV